MAQRFTFRLETLLRVRALRARTAERNVGAKRAEIARVEQLQHQLADEIQRQQVLLRDLQSQGDLDPLSLQRGRAWVAHLRRQTGTQQQRRGELERELRTLLDVLREARRETRVLEKLRERRFNAHRQAEDRAAEATADELAQQLQRFRQDECPQG
ncbi:MAG: flagellar FliJ family protein [Phycisphaerales bacterium]|nr:flagellar FliJ family protein [Phycisphaerales bacterium]